MRSICFSGLLILTAALQVAPGQVDRKTADQALEEFRGYWTNKNPFVRKAAVEGLSAVDHVRVTRQLLKCLKDPAPVVVAAATAGLASQRNELGTAELIQRMWRGRVRKERVAIIQAFKVSVPDQAYSAVLDLLEDKDWELRLHGCELAARYGDREGRGLGAILPLTEDKEVLVRLAAMDSLSALDNPRAHPTAVERLSDPDWRVRASAIKVCRKYRRKSSIAPLIRLLNEEDGRLVDDAAAALRDICDRDIPGDHARWSKWWARVEDEFKVPTAEEIARRRRTENTRRVGYDPPRKSEYPPYHGIKTRSRRILFIVDVSASMADRLTLDHGNPKAVKEFEKRYGSVDQTKVDIAREELINMVAGLKSYAKFNIVTFNAKAMPWQRRMVKATSSNKNKAIKMLSRLTPTAVAPTGGGVRRGSALQGQTNTFAALNACFGIFKGDEADKKAFKTEADTVFFMSDGNPSTGAITQPQALLDYVATVNRRAKLVLHCISFGNSNRPLMETLARRSDGQFVVIGH